MTTPVNNAAYVVIIGGGITGLSTAWYLNKLASERGISIHITVLEASDRWGGKIRTDAISVDGETPFIFEAGPDSFLTQKPWALQLAFELGLETRLLNTNDHMRKVYVLKQGKMIPLPDGVQLIVPTRLMPFLRSPLLSLPAKLRMGMDLFIPAKHSTEDETIAQFIRRRLGAEALDRIAEPLMSGIYNAEAEKQSLLATFPRFRALEEEHGSLIKGILAARKPASTSNDSAKKFAMFTTFIGGTEELITALVHCLNEASSVSLITHTRIDNIDPQSEGYTISSGTEHFAADAVILTTPGYVAADLIQRMAPSAATELAEIRYVSTGTISLAYRSRDVQHPLNGFGLVIPRSENRPINAITWTSTKFDHRAPEGFVLLRVFFGGSRRPEMIQKSDVELSEMARAELASLMGITAAPALERIYRWHNANPQYDKGHLDRITAIESALPAGLYVTGSPYRGIGIPDCVFQAQQTARTVITRLNERLITA